MTSSNQGQSVPASSEPRTFHIDIALQGNNGFRLASAGQHRMATGYASDEHGRFRDSAGLLDAFSGVESEHELRDRLQTINGFFQVVHSAGNMVFAAVDRLRSMPLYYAVADGSLYLSDRAEWVRRRVGDSTWDELCMNEYRLTAYVTGADTLYRRVKQLQAGEYLVYDQATGHVVCKRYFQFQRGEFSAQSTEQLVEELDRVHVRVFERLIDSLAGRPVIVPLSGGYDSRLVCCMLRRLGYSKVICVSYGKRDNHESATSRKVADHLGYPWHYVEYHSDLWRSWFASSERLEFFRYSQVHASMPYIQDLPALAQLVQRQVLPKDAVVVPGHSYDFLCGTHIPPEFIDCPEPSVDYLKRTIYKYHYGVWRTDAGHKRRMFDARLAWLDEREVTTQEQLSCLGDEWDWQERQAKFIVNAVRGYEYLGFEWRLPLWDNDVMAFWRRIPFEHRLGRRLYFTYTAHHQGDLEAAIGVRRKPARQRNEGVVSRIVGKLTRRPLVRELRFLAKYTRAYSNHVLQLNIAPSFARHMSLYARGARDPKAVIGDGLTAEIKGGVYLESPTSARQGA